MLVCLFDMVVLLLALYNYNGAVAPGLSLYNFWVHFHSVCFLCSGCGTVR